MSYLVGVLCAVGTVVGLCGALPVTQQNGPEAEISNLKAQLSDMQRQLDYILAELSRRQVINDVNDDFTVTTPSVAGSIPTTTDSVAISVGGTEVGFSAKLSQELRDLPTFSVIKYDYVIFNAGNGYDKSTGIFTVPVEGMYMFSFFVESLGTKAAEIQLLVDGMIRFPAISDPAAQGNDDTGANMVIEHLVKGQQVWTETYESENQNIYPGFTTFHGALITPA